LDTIGSYRYGTVRIIVKGQYFYNCAILNRHPALEDYKVIELSGKVEELMWLPPGGLSGFLVLWRSDRIAAPRSCEGGTYDV
jgi:hypothetical protein